MMKTTDIAPEIPEKMKDFHELWQKGIRFVDPDAMLIETSPKKGKKISYSINAFADEVKMKLDKDDKEPMTKEEIEIFYNGIMYLRANKHKQEK